MKKVLFRSILALLVIASLLAGTGTAKALPGTTWATGIKLQNLDSTTEAQLSVEIYAGNGTRITTLSQNKSGGDLIAAAGKSVELYLPDYQFGAGTYSAIVLSNVEVGAVVTNTNYAYGLADSYNSMKPATTVAVPYVYHNHNSWSTEIFIQNTSSTTDATVEVNFVEPANSASAGDGVKNVTYPLTVPKNGMVSVDTSNAVFGSGTYNLGWFIGAATVTSTNSIPVAVAVSQIRLIGPSDARGNVMISGSGLTSTDAGSKVVLPSLYNKFTGVSGTWQSGIKIQNMAPVGGATAEVTVTFTSDPNAPAFSTNNVKTVSIPGGGNAELYLSAIKMDNGTTVIPDYWRGSAVVNATGADVVATVQHTNYVGAAGYGVAMGYAGFSQGAPEVSLPTLYNWVSGAGVWVSGIKIQNMESTPVTVDVEFSPDPDSPNQTAGTRTSLVLDGNSAKEIYFGDPVIGSGDTPNVRITTQWKGSGVIRVQGSGTVVATVVNTNYGRHVSSMYTGVPVPAAP